MHGKATRTTKRRSLAAVPHDVTQRRAAKLALKRPPVRFTGEQALSIGRAFCKAAEEGKYVLYACSILPDHVHLVLASHWRPIKQIVGHLKAMASRQLVEDGRHPFQEELDSDGFVPTPRVKGCWKRFLRSRKENPIKMGLPRQRWRMVRVYH